MIAAPAIFITTSQFFYWLKEYKKNSKFVWFFNFILILIIALPIRYTIERTKLFQKIDRNPQWALQVKNIKKLIPQGKTVIIFNIENPIETMFYNDCVAYSLIPDIGTVENLQKKRFTIIINDDGKLNKEQFKNNKNIIIKELTR